MMVDADIDERSTPLLVEFPQRRGGSLCAAALGTDMEHGHHLTATAPVLHTPKHVVSAQHFGVGLAVEGEAAARTRHDKVASGGHLTEGTRQSGSVPATGGAFLRGHDTTDMVGEHRPVGFLVVHHLSAGHGAVCAMHPLVGSSHSQHRQRIVDLCETYLNG